MLQLDRTGQGVLLVIDSEGRLLRVVTDGDLRRLLIGGTAIEDVLAKMPMTSPICLSDGASPEQAMALMNERLIDHVPVVDDDGKPIAIFLRKELDARIYLSTPHLGGQEMAFIEDAFRTNWIAPLGPNVDAFESEIAEYVGSQHGAALVSGTAAIHLALRVLDVEHGDIVLCSSLTFVASANPVMYQGAVPVFVDSNEETWSMSPRALEKALRWTAKSGIKPKAAIVVSLYGQSADMDPILALCSQHGVDVIEDAAESLGATYRGRHSGAIGRVGIFSFNGNKIITTSGGGMIVSNERALIERARFLSTQARDSAPHYEHSQCGYNYRMSNVLAGIGRGQLRVLERRIQQRRRVYEWYREYLAGNAAICWMPEAAYGRATRWLTAFYLDPQTTRVRPPDIIRALAVENIEARPVWKPMHRQPLYRNAPYFSDSNSPGPSISDRLFDFGVCLPSGSDLTETQIQRICRIIRSVLESRAAA
jgi:dTDP-4-amino-4,6-dideoxygalactose transaminase